MVLSMVAFIHQCNLRRKKAFRHATVRQPAEGLILSDECQLTISRNVFCSWISDSHYKPLWGTPLPRQKSCCDSGLGLISLVSPLQLHPSAKVAGVGHKPTGLQALGHHVGSLLWDTCCLDYLSHLLLWPNSADQLILLAS